DNKLPDEVVVDLLENIYSPAGLEAIGASHATAKKEIREDTALRGILGTSVPLHGGAEKYYKAKGVLK
ncbi:MAG: TAXI family TRAP transporter solute-binding subunit, partial [Candidatus Accumulibacter sp.]|nr:TAXI family TRAP transporter solute-binding subunit [Accumulibacter sp.]